MKLKSVGIIHTPYKTVGEAPRQGKYVNTVCELEVFEEFRDGLRDVEECKHLIILYWLHKAERDRLIVHPPHSPRPKGVFATRSPHRPNPIGFCVVELVEKKGNVLRVKGLDAIDGTPILDIKPYSPELDSIPNKNLVRL